MFFSCYLPLIYDYLFTMFHHFCHVDIVVYMFSINETTLHTWVIVCICFIYVGIYAIAVRPACEFVPNAPVMSRERTYFRLFNCATYGKHILIKNG